VVWWVGVPLLFVWMSCVQWGLPNHSECTKWLCATTACVKRHILDQWPGCEQRMHMHSTFRSRAKLAACQLLIRAGQLHCCWSGRVALTAEEQCTASASSCGASAKSEDGQQRIWTQQVKECCRPAVQCCFRRDWCMLLCSFCQVIRPVLVLII
jgi:hypothetical protein